MIPFEYKSPSSLDVAQLSLDHHQVMALGGGTTLLDLMKLNVLQPRQLVHVKPLLNDHVEVVDGKLVIGAGCTMAKLADSDPIKKNFPALRQSLILAASPQIRNMATIGGNLLQRTRSTYFRHPDMPDDALQGEHDALSASGVDTTYLAVLGNDGRLVGTYPGDFAVALVAFDGSILVKGREGQRTIKAREFYKTPRGHQTQYSTQLDEGELISHVTIPVGSAEEFDDVTQQSFYLKIRERSSYAFALVSIAAGLSLEGDSPNDEQTIVDARIAIGGLASIPWHSAAAESALIGKKASDETFRAASEAALAEARPPVGTQYKVLMAKRAMIRALQILRDEGKFDDERLWAMQHGRA
ncbi:FAD binding domain-containing protein [Bremerella alba]|uniref:Putative xanthine dehydrogenase YagS FAD-binding subunit n=1 Tax=Bremerella alba TaxID=980252 RepID=A0A7V8V292_9BACT|nr:xanthine dehydrogenase family protein subunit M [Bremerella alba]MBA2113592.1 putative xanthine dehydrogenase YagS FAD-binding subunit [Bremerella alba]